MWRISRLRILALSGFILLAGCAQSGLRIGNTVTLCCPGSYGNYGSYGVQVAEMPLFLQDWLLEMFDRAFQERGMTRNDQVNDLVVTLRYRHVNLNAEKQDIDPLIRQESFGEELRYIAVVEISMRESASGDPVWGGEISRIHTVSPGEYMHEGPARAAFLETFRDLLAAYPGRD